jgi:hypothetical protein
MGNCAPILPLLPGMVPVMTWPTVSVSVTVWPATFAPKFQKPNCWVAVCPPATALATGNTTFWK